MTVRRNKGARTKFGKRAGAILKKVKKDLKLKGRKNGGMRRNATSVLVQGAVALPKKNFGTTFVKQKRTLGLVRALDARIPRTLGLPRAVGPYTVIRTTKLHQSSASFITFCPVRDLEFNHWYAWAGFEDVSATLPITDPNNAKPILMPMGALANACEVVPSALTVQVMNPASLQDADGIFAMGRVNQQLPIGQSTITWDELAARFVSFYSPRMLTGGKLALRGVKCSAYPLDMSEYADFSTINQYAQATVSLGNKIRPGALSPIVFIQNNTNPKTLEFMVTIEWRVRFDPGNPATSSHSFHDTLSDEAWNSVIKTMSNMGHGVEELADDVLDAGAMYGAATALL